MQPLVLTLPDTIRDRLEAVAQLAPPQGMHAYEHALREVMFPLRPAADEQAFLSRFQEALLAMHTGHGCPVLVLRNLPQNNHELLPAGFQRLLGDGKRHFASSIVLDEHQPQAFHHDFHFESRFQRKVISQLYCEHPGTEKQPTVFTTADEVLDELAAITGTPRETLADSLQKPKNIIDKKPVLARNPNFTPGCGAPEFILLTSFMNAKDYNPQGKDPKHQTILDDALATLHARESAVATTSTEPNSLAIFNQGMVLHARGNVQGEGVQESRSLKAYDTTARVVRPHDAASHVAASPASKVTSLRLFGKTLATYVQR